MDGGTVFGCIVIVYVSMLLAFGMVKLLRHIIK